MVWNSGGVVRLRSGSQVMEVIGCDSVGSVICRPLNDERHLGLYVPPSSLVAAARPSDPPAPAHQMEMALEDA